MKLWGQAGRGQSVTSLHFAYPFPRFTPPQHHSILSPFIQPHQPTSSSVPSCRPPRVGELLSQLSFPAVLLLPFFFIKLLKRQSAAVAWYPACWPSQSVQLQRAPSSPHLCPSPNQVPRLFSGSNGILSVAIGTIGKQRPKMNYPVSSSSLMNNQTGRSRTLRCDCIVKYLLMSQLRHRSIQLAASLSRRAVPYRSLLPLLGYNFHFFHFIQFLETAAGGEVDRTLIFISSFHLFTDSAKYPAGQHLCLPLPAQLVVPACRPTSASRGDRPVAAETIGKQRPKIYFPVSSPSLTSKHSKVR